VIAALSAWHQDHEAAREALTGVTALPAHALTEAYGVLTRLPAGLAVPPRIAADVLSRRFPDTPLSVEDRHGVLRTLARAGVLGGATYDGLVALEAARHDETLVTLDRRAQRTYERLGARFEAIASTG
jgi:hypothetical protein